jgi:hypothetical protein
VSTFGAQGELDPRKGIIAFFCGKKRSGKSVLAMAFFRAYPGDKISIDIAQDDGPTGPDVITITGTLGEGTLPTSWPNHLRRYTDKGKPLPMILRYTPDAGSTTFQDDLDAIIGMVLKHGECCVLVHEIGVLAAANKTKLHTRRLLMHNRHDGATTALFCGPRSQGIDPLVLQQADLVFTFELMSKSDRMRVAENIGWDPIDFNEAVLALGPHEYLRFDANAMKPADGQPDYRLVHVDALPADEVKAILRWQNGGA